MRLGFFFHKKNTLTVYEQDDSWDLVSHADAILLDHDYHYQLSWKKENNISSSHFSEDRKHLHPTLITAVAMGRCLQYIH